MFARHDRVHQPLRLKKDPCASRNCSPPCLLCQNHYNPATMPDPQQIAKLALEDGAVFTGRHFGALGTSEGEVVFNTSMTGYQEILTDPSYKGQIVTMTYPLIGNYGINRQDVESKRPHVAGFVIKELAPLHSNYRADMS